jgi:hypothetical protein
VPPNLAMERRSDMSASIRTVERARTKTLNVTWSDARMGYFTEQRWRRTHARWDSVCALTGTAISRGDAVYRPHACAASVPTNPYWMILASQIEHCLIPSPLET